MEIRSTNAVSYFSVQSWRIPFLENAVRLWNGSKNKQEERLRLCCCRVSYHQRSRCISDPVLRGRLHCDEEQVEIVRSFPFSLACPTTSLGGKLQEVNQRLAFGEKNLMLGGSKSKKKLISQSLNHTKNILQDFSFWAAWNDYKIFGMVQHIFCKQQ